jgi:hypothetical protein
MDNLALIALTRMLYFHYNTFCNFVKAWGLADMRGLAGIADMADMRGPAGMADIGGITGLKTFARPQPPAKNIYAF